MDPIEAIRRANLDKRDAALEILRQEAERARAKQAPIRHCAPAATPPAPAGATSPHDGRHLDGSSKGSAEGAARNLSVAAATSPLSGETRRKPPRPFRTMPNRKEKALLVDLLILRNSLAMNSESCKERARRHPGGWRDLRLLLTLVDRVQGQLMDTVPDKYVEEYIFLANHGKLRVDLPGPVRHSAYSTVDNEAMEALLETALRHECSVCTRTGSEARDCPLRRAMIACAPPEEIDGGILSSCEYERYAVEMLKGQEVHL